MSWRENYAKFISGYDHKRGAELGVLQGKNASVLLRILTDLEMLYCVDHWGNVATAIKYLEAIKPYQDRVRTLWMQSTEAPMFIENESLDFIFIDASHVYRNVVADIVCWVPKVKMGGIISGHDYMSDKYDVKGAVDKLFPNANTQGEIWWITKQEGKQWEEWASA